MSLFHLKKFLVFYFILAPITKSQRNVLWRRDGKRLEATSITTVKVATFENCFGFCESHTHCKSFSVNHTSMMCELFAVDRCMPRKELISTKGSSYFDLVGDGQCALPCK